jgi:hypothetical protein
MDDYRGPFDPTVGLESFSRRALASIGREYMLFGHLLNRASLPWVHVKLGAEAREQVAIEEWMGASPVYTRRMQRAMGFSGDDVATILKGMQLDVGFAHQYMDVRYALDADRGSFWLPSCGALLEVEPHGEAAVKSMCHAIEDPTFDATAVATNPRARCRPVHRPPRRPADRLPHCLWDVFIDRDADPVQEIALTARVRASRLAGMVFAEPRVAAGPGLASYDGPFVPDLNLEMLSHAALVTVCREFLVQDHLLVRALMMSVAGRAGDAAAAEIGLQQWVGAGAVASTRLAAALGVAQDDVGAILKVLQLHPAFVPGYTAVSLRLDDPEHGVISIADCDALREGDRYSWFALLGDAAGPALDAMVRAVNPRACCRPVPPPPGARHAWQVLVDPTGTPAAEPTEATMVRGTGTARFVFTPHAMQN